MRGTLVCSSCLGANIGMRVHGIAPSFTHTCTAHKSQTVYNCARAQLPLSLGCLCLRQWWQFGSQLLASQIECNAVSSRHLWPRQGQWRQSDRRLGLERCRRQLLDQVWCRQEFFASGGHLPKFVMLESHMFSFMDGLEPVEPLLFCAALHIVLRDFLCEFWTRISWHSYCSIEICRLGLRYFSHCVPYWWVLLPTFKFY